MSKLRCKDLNGRIIRLPSQSQTNKTRIFLNGRNLNMPPENQSTKHKSELQTTFYDASIIYNNTFLNGDVFGSIDTKRAENIPKTCSTCNLSGKPLVG